MKWAPWILLGAVVWYRRTWGACDCEALRRRLVAAQREVHGYQVENLDLIRQMEEK